MSLPQVPTVTVQTVNALGGAIVTAEYKGRTEGPSENALGFFRGILEQFYEDESQLTEHLAHVKAMLLQVTDGMHVHCCLCLTKAWCSFVCGPDFDQCVRYAVLSFALRIQRRQ